MPGCSLGQLSSRQTLGYLFGGWSTFIFSLMVLAGHEPLKSLGAATMVALQFTAGFVLWQLLSNGLTHEIVGGAAMGAVFGAVLAALGGIVVAGTPLVRIGWILPVVVALSVVRRLRPIERSAPSTLRWLVAASLLGLSTEWTWIFPIALMAALVAPGSRISKLTKLFLLFFLGAMQVVILVFRSPYWTQFRFSLTEVSDYSFFEAVAKGTANWANLENVLFSGGDLSYHWISYAWAGNITNTLSSASPAFSSHLIQIAFVTAIVGLVYLVAVVLGAPTHFAVAAALTIVMVVAFPFGALGGLVVHSPSQLFGTAVLIALVFLFSQVGEAIGWKGFLLLAILTMGAIGGKAATIPAVLTVVAVGGWGLGSARAFWKRISVVLVLIVVASVGFIYFFDVGGNGSTRPLRFSPLEVLYTEGSVSADVRSWWLTVAGLVAFTAGVIAVVPGVLLPRRTLSQASARLQSLLLAAASTTFLVGFLFVGDVSYFFNLGISLLIPVSIFRISQEFPKLDSKNLLVLVFVSLVSAASISLLVGLIDDDQVAASIALSIIFVLPVVIGFIGGLFVSSQRLVVSVILIVGIAASSYLSWIPRFAAIQFNNGVKYVADMDSISGSPGMRDAAEWLGDNSSQADVFATNRFCNFHYETFPKCAAFRTVITGISGLSAFVENVDWMSAPRAEVIRRAWDSIAFAEEPSALTLENLRNGNVTWFVVDKSVTRRTNWEPWAEVVFENEDAYILRVLGTTGMP